MYAIAHIDPFPRQSCRAAVLFYYTFLHDREVELAQAPGVPIVFDAFTGGLTTAMPYNEKKPSIGESSCS